MTGWQGTPGPWKADRNFGCKRISAKPFSQHRQAKRFEVACTPGLNSEPEDQANADGMAAVPQLVEALLPFAECAERMHDQTNGVRLLPDGHNLTVGDVRRALDALRAAKVLP